MSYPEQPNPANQSESQHYPENSMRSADGEKHAKTSLILGIISIFIFGIILGPLAIMQAKKAQALNVNADAGKITGWIGLIVGIISIVWAIFSRV